MVASNEAIVTVLRKQLCELPQEALVLYLPRVQIFDSFVGVV